ncbi:MAG: hypothetical protein ACR2MN_09260 [Acidimicrobiales bacterium]
MPPPSPSASTGSSTPIRRRWENAWSSPGDGGTARHLGTVAARELTLLKGAAIPLVVLIIAEVGGVGPRDGTTAAVVAAVFLLVVLEAIAARRCGLSTVALVVQISVSAVIGTAVLALKIAIH